jgi:hypothetical protein
LIEGGGLGIHSRAGRSDQVNWNICASTLRGEARVDTVNNSPIRRRKIRARRGGGA